MLFKNMWMHFIILIAPPFICSAIHLQCLFRRLLCLRDLLRDTTECVFLFEGVCVSFCVHTGPLFFFYSLYSCCLGVTIPLLVSSCVDVFITDWKNNTIQYNIIILLFCCKKENVYIFSISFLCVFFWKISIVAMSPLCFMEQEWS